MYYIYLIFIVEFLTLNADPRRNVFLETQCVIYIKELIARNPSPNVFPNHNVFVLAMRTGKLPFLNKYLGNKENTSEILCLCKVYILIIVIVFVYDY
jgi:hypothetical protein